MKIVQARKSVIIASLVIVGSNILFFFFAPSLGYPLEFNEAISILQIILPVFLGYLGTATQFMFQQPSSNTPPINLSDLLPYLLWGPLVIFSLANIGAIISFGITNGTGASPGSGMTPFQLSLDITICLSLLAVTTNTIVSYLFAKENAAQLG